jgi:hypothetical protein
MIFYKIFLVVIHAMRRMIMFQGIDLKKLGEICRRKRRQLGYILEDLEDEHISVSTISNIERGIPVVSPQKIKYY